MKFSDTPMSAGWEPTWPEDDLKPLFNSTSTKGRLGSRSGHKNNLRLAHDLWCAHDQIRAELGRGDKGLLVGLIAALIARSGGNLISLSTEIAALGGDHLYCRVQELIHEFDGPDPERHLWYQSAPGTYDLTA